MQQRGPNHSRIGDAGFILGVLIIWTYVGTLNFQEIFQRVRAPERDSHESLVERVVSASAERVLDQFRDHLLGGPICPSVGDWNKFEAALMRPIGGEIARFADRLASRPEVAVRVPATFALSGALPAPAQSFVHMSLLNTLPSVQPGARS